MMGCYDFCGHYEWTFDWLERTGGEPLLHAFWRSAIAADSQQHAREAITNGGFDGMETYWGHTLAEESPDLGYAITRGEDFFRVDMHDCPSKGFLLRNGLAHYRDYCDHCIGWIGPVMQEAGFVIDHEHNHCGQCWWVIRRPGSSASGAAIASANVCRRPEWQESETVIDRYLAATGPRDKTGA